MDTKKIRLASINSGRKQSSKFVAIIIFGIILLTSCDKLLTEEFIVDNEYKDSVCVELENANGYKVDKIIPPLTKDFVLYINTGYGQSVHEFDLVSLFNYFVVSVDSIRSKKDYKKNSNWEYFEHSETLAEFRLKIDSSHFIE